MSSTAEPIEIQPPVEEILAVDAEFRRRVLRGERFVHTTRDGRRYSALYSTSAFARRFGRMRDWVIIDLEAPGPNPHWTVVTERRGVLKGKRVVRGREAECFHVHRQRAQRRSHGRAGHGRAA